MPPPDRQSLRLVIQYICENSSQRSSYRVVGYSDKHTYRAVNFDSLDDLLKLLKSAVPEFDPSSISRERQPRTSILFADVIELSSAQRSALGLRE